MSDLLTEIEDSFREERLHALWKQYGNFVIFTVIAIILATALTSGYRAWDMSVRTADTNALLDLMDSPDFPKNIETADMDMRGDLKAIALLNAGGALLSKGETASALGLFTKAAEDSAISDEFRQLARLMQVRLESKNEAADTTALIDHLKTIADSDNSPWQPHARLDMAALMADRQGRYQEAVAVLNSVMETQGLPDTIYARARDLQHMYTLLKPAESAAPETNAETKPDHES
jgi:hypothetical protein